MKIFCKIILLILTVSVGCKESDKVLIKTNDQKLNENSKILIVNASSKDTLKVDEIPGLTKGEIGFEGTIQIKVWAGFQSRNGAYGLQNSLEKSDGNYRLATGGDMGDENPEIKDYHVKAYKYLLQNQEELKNKILDTLLVGYRNLQDIYGYEGEEKEEVMPDISKTSEFSNLIGISNVHLMNVEKDGVGYVGYEFGCTWDMEHGLGVMTHKNRIVDIGGAARSFMTWVARQDLKNNEIKK